jgi:UDP-N-acetylglucosamine 3-dehydrogenase
MMSGSTIEPSTAWRMAVIGCGRVGNLHAQAIAGHQGAALVAVCDPDRERSTAMAERYRARAYSSLSQLLAAEKLDAVTIATPDHLHVAPVLAAIAGGCHVFCEKPLAESAADAARVVQAAAERGVHLAVDYNRRVAFGYRTARRLLDEGAIGKLDYCLLRVTDRTPGAAVARHPHVMFTTLLTHHLDLMRHFGGEILRVQATAGDEPPGALLRNVSISLRFTSGAIGTIVAGYRDALARTVEWMELGGSAGSLVVEDVTRRVIVVGKDPDRSEVFEPNHFISSDAFDDTIVEHVRDFITRVASGNAPGVTGRDGLAGLRLAAAAVESLRTARFVEVPAL